MRLFGFGSTPTPPKADGNNASDGISTTDERGVTADAGSAAAAAAATTAHAPEPDTVRQNMPPPSDGDESLFTDGTPAGDDGDDGDDGMMLVDSGDDDSSLPPPVPPPRPSVAAQPPTMAQIEHELLGNQGAGAAMTTGVENANDDEEAQIRVDGDQATTQDSSAPTGVSTADAGADAATGGADDHNAKNSSDAQDETETTRGDSASASFFSRHKRVWFALACLLLLVVVSQIVVIVLVVIRRNSDNGNGSISSSDASNTVRESDGNKDPAADTSAPTDPLLPTATPTPQPTKMPIFSSQYDSVANTPDAYLSSMVSTCDECAELTLLPFTFMFRGTTPVEEMEITSNGELRFVNCGQSSSAAYCGSVSVAFGDLNPQMGGDIWVKYFLQDVATQSAAAASVATATASENSDGSQRRDLQDLMPSVSSSANRIVISWENVAFAETPESFIQAQATLYETGDVQICFGSANIKSNQAIRVGMRDNRDGDFVTPPPGEIFESNGNTKSGSWPTDECMAFTHTFQFQDGPIIETEDDGGSGNQGDDASQPPTPVPTPVSSSSWYPTPSQSRYPTNSDTDVPTDEPTDFNDWPWTSPTSYPTFTPPMPDTFQSMIGYSTKSYRLQRASFCDSCDEQVRLPFPFMWMGPRGESNWIILVLSDGSIELNSGSIRVVSTDLDGGSGGEIWALAESDHVVISWEGMPLYNKPGSQVYAQAWLYESGTVDLCYGPSDIKDGTFQAGLFDHVHNGKMPAIGFPFDEDGNTRHGNYPPEGCQRLISSTMSVPEWTPHPTDYTYWTNYPTEQGTNHDHDHDQITVQMSSLYTRKLQSLRNNPFAERLDDLSGCFACGVEVMPPFTLHWLNQTSQPVHYLIVHDSGLVDACSWQQGCIGIVTITSPALNGQFGSNVFLLYNNTFSSSLTISWENYGSNSSSQDDAVNVQVTMFDNGDIQMCWGSEPMPRSSETQSVIVDWWNDAKHYAPEGRPFDSFGYHRYWPTDQCQLFDFTAQNEDGHNSPTPQPTWWYDTLPPTTQPSGDVDFQYSTSDLFYSEFKSLANDPQSRKLAGTENCGGACSETIPVGIQLNWMNQSKYEVTHLNVWQNGLIEACTAFMGCVGSSAIINTEIQTVSSGNVYVLVNSTLNNATATANSTNSTNSTTTTTITSPSIPSVTISWENVTLRTSRLAVVSAQMTIYSNGTIRACWGNSAVSSFMEPMQAFTWDYYSGNQYPAEGRYFDFDGFFYEWPYNTCQNFYFKTIVPVPTTSPTWSPTITPSPSINQDNDYVNVTMSKMYVRNMTELSSSPNATWLSGLQCCDYCTQDIRLPFSVSWLGTYRIDRLVVVTDGYVEVCDSQRCYGNVEVVSTDLQTFYGGMYYQYDKLSITIGWEDIQPYGVDGFVNAWLTIYASGSIRLCYGEGKLNGIVPRAGIWESRVGYSIYPVGRDFDDYGNMWSWPTNQCQDFAFEAQYWGNEPTTWQPAGFPTFSPSPHADHGRVEVERSPLYRPANNMTMLSTHSRAEQLKSSDQHGDAFLDTVKLPFSLSWVNTSRYVDELEITRAGQIYLCSYPDCHGLVEMALPVVGNISNITAYDVFMLTNYTGTTENSTVIISWEAWQPDVPIWARIGKQVKLFGNGTIELCWGHNIANPNSGHVSSITDFYTDAFPAEGFVFAGDGYHEEWPTNLCQLFMFTADSQYGGYPTPSPTDFYTHPPHGDTEVFVSPLFDSPMQSLRGLNGTFKLQNLDACDWCDEKVELPFPISSFGKMQPVPIGFLRIGIDGYIELCSNDGGCIGNVEAVAGDLDSSTNGDVYLRYDFANGTMNSSVTVSWENVGIYGQPGSFVNAQATLFVNGTVKLCWGTARGSLADIRSNIINYFERSFPATGQPFDEYGHFKYWPTNLCQMFMFSVSSSNYTQPPYYSPPTSAPTNSTGSLVMARSGLYYTPVLPIANLSSTQKLHRASSCWGCSEDVKTPASFLWRDGLYYHNVSVHSEGYIVLNGCYDWDGASCGQINIAAYGLDVKLGGGVHSTMVGMNTTNPGLIVAWEGIGMAAGTSERVDAQVRLYLDGTFILCWGNRYNASDRSVSAFASILEYAYGADFPAKGYLFDEYGAFYEWPENLCQNFSFVDEDDGDGDDSTKYPTAAPNNNTSSLIRTPFPMVAKNFVSLSSVEGAFELLSVSNCDECFEFMESPFPFLWLGNETVTEFNVSVNGLIEFPSTCDGWPPQCSGIAVAAADMDTSQGGSVWAYSTRWDARIEDLENTLDDYLTISWENVNIFQQIQSVVNAQATVFPNGTIELCWGSQGNVDTTIVSGIYDSRSRQFIGAYGNNMTSPGYISPGTWPAGQCQLFLNSDGSVPSSCPTYVTANAQWTVTEPFQLAVSSSVDMRLEFFNNMTSNVTVSGIQIWTVPNAQSVSYGLWFEDGNIPLEPRDTMTVGVKVDLSNVSSSETGLAFRLRSFEFGTLEPRQAYVQRVSFECDFQP